MRESGNGVELEVQQELERFCLISSASSDVPGLWAMARAYAAALQEVGLTVQVEAQEGKPLLVAESPGAQPPYVLVVGHLDTVLPARPVLCQDGQLYGSGAVDMKGGLVALLGALGLLQRQGLAPPANLLVVVVPDEEASAAVSRAAMTHWGALAELALVMEPGERQGERETLVLGRKGLGEFTLTFRGLAAHAGLAFHQGRSALLAACQFVAAAEALSAGSRTVNCCRLVAGDREFVTQLGSQAQLLTASDRRNVVPDTAVVVGEFRFAREEEGKALAVQLEELARTVARQREVEVVLAFGQWVAPVEAAAGSWLAELAQQVATSLSLPLEVETCRGGISLPNFFQRPDLPVVDGLGPVGGGMHTEEEFVDLRSLGQRTQLVAQLLRRLAGRGAAL
ncbi:MAG: M20/M25/M40 family metallo-hydrolase [Thermoanaerobaculum sp.]|nr:M20/M25/M40 family metallo-hydrolase [Thermoanaerobaculum sp.]MDW7966779.1 M20/M25/M40 family metallo-hydrolase [Thermoanaerobaculum sp.]